MRALPAVLCLLSLQSLLGSARASLPSREIFLSRFGEAGQGSREAVPFVDATADSGLDFVHVNGATGELLLPEVIGAGGALFDYDNDGDLDLFAVQGSLLRPLPDSS